MSTQPDHYAVLGVPPRASVDEIHRAYRAEVQRYHPDRHSGNVLRGLAEERLAQINASYEVLKDPYRRATYDAARGGMAGPVRRTAPPRFLRPVIAILVMALFALALRYLSNPRLLLYAVIITAVIWVIAIIVRGRGPPMG